MSLARRALLISSRSNPIFLAQRRAASSSSHDHHDHHHEDTTAYPPESFGTSFWRNVVLASLATVAIFKYAPEADKDVYLSRWIAMYTAPKDYWLSLNVKHSAQAAQLSADTLLVNDAQQPPIHRYTYPRALNQASPFLNGVGMQVDMEGVVPKTTV